MIDLQNHTIASDGELAPEELVDLAIEKKLSAIAITDHDSIGSVKKAVKYAQGKGIEVVPGVELSCDDPLFDYDKIDVLGLFVDVDNEELIRIIKHINDKREENKEQIIGKLKSFGYEIEYEEVRKTVRGSFGNPHIAKYLMKKYPEEFSSVREVFEKLLRKGKKAFIQTTGRVSIKEAIRIIKGAKGIAILAHPGIYPKDHAVKLIDYFIENDGDGMETYYPYHIICPDLKMDEKGNEKLIQLFRKIARSKNILESGGNDHHDKGRFTLGVVKIPDSVLVNLKKRIPLS